MRGCGAPGGGGVGEEVGGVGGWVGGWVGDPYRLVRFLFFRFFWSAWPLVLGLCGQCHAVPARARVRPPSICCAVGWRRWVGG